MADKKITELNEEISPSSNDLLTIISNVNTSPENKKISIDSIYKYIYSTKDNIYSGKKVVIVNPYQEKTGEYKGQLHCHSTNSDGADTPTALVTAYKNAGYDFVSITDHDKLTADPGVAGILFIPGIEETSSGHITSTNATAIQSTTDAQTLIDGILSQGAIPGMAHPDYPAHHWTDTNLESLVGYMSLEVYNAFSRENAETKWDTALSKYIRTYGTAVDDAHDISDPRWNKAWVKVFSDGITLADIMDSLKRGNFYATQGPEMAVNVSGNVITVTTDDSSTIEFIGNGGAVLQTTSTTTSESYTIVGNEVYVRIRITRDSDSLIAWSNPIYVILLSDSDLQKGGVVRGNIYITGDLEVNGISFTDLQGFNAKVSTDGIISGFNFNEKTIQGTLAIDSSPYNRNGTISGAVFDSDGGFNGSGALDFDGVDDYVQLETSRNIKSFLVSGKEATPQGVFFKSDGLEMYIIGATSDEVHQYTLSVAWDVTTAVFTRSSTVVAAKETAPVDVSFSADGLNMYIVGQTGNDITYFTLSTAWDISTLSYVGEFSVATQDGTPEGIFMKADGAVMYIVGNDNNSIYQYSLSTPWDMSTASYVSTLSLTETSPRAIYFKDDGLKMYVLDASSQAIVEYGLTSAWDITTATVTGFIFFIGYQEGTAGGLSFKADGTKIFIVGSVNDTVYSYDISAWSLSDSDYQNGFSLCAWIKPDTLGESSGGRIFDSGSDVNSTGGYNFFNTTTTRVSGRVGAGTARVSGDDLTLGDWNFVVMTVASDSTISFYINGVLSGTPATTGPLTKITSPNIRIGSNNGTNRSFDGIIDEPRIYKRVLSADEVLRLYLQKDEIINPLGIIKMSATERGLITSPESGMVIYNTTTKKLNYYNGTYWEIVVTQTPGVTKVNSATYDLLVTDYILNCDYTATGAITSLTLPTAQMVNGRVITIKDSGGLAGTNNITIDTEGTEKIDGADTYVINVNYDSVTIYSNGVGWFVI